jgi:hypothetical protein
VNTLLGPEGTTWAGLVGSVSALWGRWLSFGSRHDLVAIPADRLPVCGRGFGLVVAVRVVGWLWVENCIVDASILFSVVR